MCQILCPTKPIGTGLWGDVTKILILFLQSQPKYLTCISISCLFLAIKMVEEDENVPNASDFMQVSGVSCSSSELLRMERIVLDKLGWDLNPATPLYFLQVVSHNVRWNTLFSYLWGIWIIIGYLDQVQFCQPTFDRWSVDALADRMVGRQSVEINSRPNVTLRVAG